MGAGETKRSLPGAEHLCGHSQGPPPRAHALQHPTSRGSSHDHPHFLPKQQRPEVSNERWHQGTGVSQVDAEGTLRVPRTLHPNPELPGSCCPPPRQSQAKCGYPRGGSRSPPLRHQGLDRVRDAASCSHQSRVRVQSLPPTTHLSLSGLARMPPVPLAPMSQGEHSPSRTEPGLGEGRRPHRQVGRSLGSSLPHSSPGSADSCTRGFKGHVLSQRKHST